MPVSPCVPVPVHQYPGALRRLIAVGVLSVLLYIVLAIISRQFRLTVSSVDRPHLLVQGLLGLLFVGYLFALRIAVTARDECRLLSVIVLFAMGFRGLLLGTTPIQEIDMYRYVWDGNAIASGVNPYRYSPRAVETAGETTVNSSDGGSADEAPLPGDLRRLVLLVQRSPALAEILGTIHYGELTTPYPPVSQAVFALAALVTPDHADVSTRLLVMKAWIVLFDLLTIFVMIGLLRSTGVSAGWCLAYAWCPLVVKEFANSGHLDAIAVCLTTAALWQLIGVTRGSYGRLGAAAVLFGLGIGAKLYPLVLLPLLVACLWRRVHAGHALAFVTIAVLVAGISLWPMLSVELDVRGLSRERASAADSSTDVSGREERPATTPAPSGLTTFLTRWQMNDLLFRIVDENLDPSRPRLRQPWFAIAADDVRLRLVSPLMQWFDLDASAAAFLAARGLTLSIVLLIAGVLIGRCCFAHKSTRQSAAAGSREVLEAAFLMLAWLWLLAPTQNPWYWTWCLPLIPFARNRVWLAASGLTMIYYLRFWLNAHWPEPPGPWGSDYDGALFFDFVVVWFEFVPLLGSLLVGWTIGCRGREQ